MSSEEPIEQSDQFVYIYRDKSGSPMYVGRGRKIGRSQSHTGSRAHNEDLTEALAFEKVFSIEIAGPFGTEKIAGLVEAALISAFNQTPTLKRALHNKNDGLSLANFRPLGVPNEFADRALLPSLDAQAIHDVTGQRPVLIVLVNDRVLSDGRPGIDLANPPSSQDIQRRIVCWWQLRGFMSDWRDNPLSIPAVLIAVSGSRSHRIVVGSLAIDDDPSRLPWKGKKAGGAQVEVPVKPHAELDFGHFRGRRISSEIATFGQGKHEHFRLI